MHGNSIGKRGLRRFFGISLIALIILLLNSAVVFAKPVLPEQAKAVVSNWLKIAPTPLETRFAEPRVSRLEAFKENGTNLYYIVYLQQETGEKGFVVVPGDDLIEPIVGFFPDATEYTPSLTNPVGALVHQDLSGRMNKALSIQNQDTPQGTESEGLTGDAAESEASKHTEKWRYLETADRSQLDYGTAAIDDVRVAPLLSSQWSQQTACGNACYNIFTPNNYPCGCVATAMAQLMRYFEHPAASVGTPQFTVYVDDVEQTEALLGGDDAGGPYSWSDMDLTPDCSTTLAERQHIGRLTHDAGAAVNMSYTENGSGANTLAAADAFENTFDYSNAVKGYNNGENIGSSDLRLMVNPNLCASLPVLLGITGDPGGHAIVCDGYGYNTQTLYHHLNMGWAGYDDAWYNLPTIDTSPGTFTSVYKCVYNNYTAGSGEVLSGRVTDSSGEPLDGVTVEAASATNTYTCTSDSNGIFSLSKLPSNTSYTVTATKTGYEFAEQTITTGLSTDLGDVGNRLANFQPLGCQWTQEFSIDVESATGDFQCLGVEFDGGSFWITGGNSAEDPNMLYKLDQNGNLLSTYEQPSASTGWGWRDLAWDGTYLYASAGSDIDQIDPASGTVTEQTITGPLDPNRALAYDPSSDHFWTADFSSSICEINRSGDIINTYPNTKSIYGMAWDDTASDGPWLWIWSQEPDENEGKCLCSQFNPRTGSYTGLGYSGANPPGGIAGGAGFAAINGSELFLGLHQADPDTLVGYSIPEKNSVPVNPSIPLLLLDE